MKIRTLTALATFLVLTACGGGGSDGSSGGGETPSPSAADSDNDGLVDSEDSLPNDASNGTKWTTMTWDNGQWD
ncbi:MAG: hypothetical protein K6L76_06410 [Agarilytica sp.]